MFLPDESSVDCLPTVETVPSADQASLAAHQSHPISLSAHHQFHQSNQASASLQSAMAGGWRLLFITSTSPYSCTVYTSTLCSLSGARASRTQRRSLTSQSFAQHRPASRSLTRVRPASQRAGETQGEPVGSASKRLAACCGRRAGDRSRGRCPRMRSRRWLRPRAPRVVAMGCGVKLWAKAKSGVCRGWATCC